MKLKMQKLGIKILTGLLVSATVGPFIFIGSAFASDNIALGRPYVMQPAPNYSLCTDEGDAVQLTDGHYSIDGAMFWGEKSTVGWTDITPVVVTIDLGRVQPISGASYSTGARSEADVQWPTAVFVLVSDDQSTWRRTGDLVKLSGRNGEVPPEAKEVEHRFRYVSDQLETRARYVRFVIIPNGRCTFCDEIEIYRGPDSLLSGEVKGPVVSDLKRLSRITATNAGIQNRLHADLAAVRARLAASRLTQGRRTALAAQLDAAEKAIPNLPDADPDTFRTIFPINNVHAEILAVNGALLRYGGLPVLSVWKTGRYDSFSLLDIPKNTTIPAVVSIDMMGNEFRAESFLLTNASEKAIVANIRLQALPGGSHPQWLTVSAIPWTDTATGVPVAAALPVAQSDGDFYPVTLPAGLTTKVWLSVDSTKLTPGDHRGALLIESGSQSLSLPFNVRVSPVRMGRPRLSLAMSDYAADSRYGRNTSEAIDLMRSHFVDSPWATNQILQLPEETDFDASGKLIKPLQADKLDQWVAQWPNARHYFVFMNVQDRKRFVNFKEGSSEFDARVRSWAKAFEQHVLTLKLKPQQFCLLLVDEPSTDEQNQQIIAWAKAIKAAAPGLTLFEDPQIIKPDSTPFQEAITLADIICPQLLTYHRGGPVLAQYYENLRLAGHQLWFYQCSGPTRTYNPQSYYRLLAWHAFARNMKGMLFWSFFDMGNARSSCNEYDSSGVSYTPVFLDPGSITGGIHWEAVREGIEDYEYLAMLRDAAGRTSNAALKSKAQALLEETSKQVIETYSDNYAWGNVRDGQFQPDVYRMRVLKLLERFNRK
jgi:hypothetical protein